MAKLNLLVIKTNQPEALKDQYALLGFEFEYHQHGNGPFHFAAEMDGFVFEIYLLKQGQEADSTTRLGFEVEGLDVLIQRLESSWKIKSFPKQTEWGYVAVVEDLDRRKVELTQK